jgi:hypothetical protein
MRWFGAQKRNLSTIELLPINLSEARFHAQEAGCGRLDYEAGGALASPYRSIPNRAMHIQTSASKPKAILKDGLNELHKIGSYKLFAWPFDTATRPGKGADIDYNHD